MAFLSFVIFSLYFEPSTGWNDWVFSEFSAHCPLLISNICYEHMPPLLSSENGCQQTNLLAHIQWLNLGLSIGNRTVFCGFLIKWAIAQFRHTRAKSGEYLISKTLKPGERFARQQFDISIRKKPSVISSISIIIGNRYACSFQSSPNIGITQCFFGHETRFCYIYKTIVKRLQLKSLIFVMLCGVNAKKKFEESATADERKRRWKTCQIRSSV